MSKAYPHVLSLALEKPWAITRPMLSVIATILGRHMAGRTIDAASFESRPLAQPSTATGIAILPIHGVVSPRMNLFSEVSGTASFQEIEQQLDAALAAPDIGTIIFDIDSPGGSVAGATECARKILAARTQKHTIAHANFEMCSAAYWLAAGATEIVAAPSASVGSIGVYSIHEDLSKALDTEGIKLTYISAGKYKVDGNEAEPLSESAHARIKAFVEHFYTHFVKAVADGRGVTPAAVRGGFGEGTVLTADDALALGMIDRIETLEETIARVQRTPPRTTRRAAAAALPPTLDATPQEPSPATGSERSTTTQRDFERAFIEMGF